MIKKYTDDKTTQILLALLKQHGIKKVVASPGTTNIAFVVGVQMDPWFEVYSSVDERSAAYIACGLSDESGEPVVITCTGATASRNYFPGLTEAFYRKLPILAITGYQAGEATGHLDAQALDRRTRPDDTIRMSVDVGKIADSQDEWLVNVKINTALLELKHNGGGPVHINLREASYGTFNTDKLPIVRKIERYTLSDNLPVLEKKKVAIFIGSHKTFTVEETNAIDLFCEKYNAVVLTDHTGGYYGKYKVLYALVSSQSNCRKKMIVDILIHIGEISGDYYSLSKIRGKETWRISMDGIIKDKFKNLTSLFEMDELSFFNHYNNVGNDTSCIKTNFYERCICESAKIIKNLPELPFSNIWIAQQIHNKIPCPSTIHFGILNTLRSWNFFELDKNIRTKCNVGGFGIDGILSTLLGASLYNENKLYYVFLGDLAFFYDLNALGNRYIGRNIRILLVNNGCGTEFKNYSHPASQWGGDADSFIAARGHFGKQSPLLVKNYSENLGFEYISANNKEEFINNSSVFLNPEIGSKPIIFEVFTNSEDESCALKKMRMVLPDDRSFQEKSLESVKQIARSIKRSF